MRRSNRKGFTLLEGLVTLSIATLILFGVFQSSFTSAKAKVQTEQGLEIENLLASRFAEFRTSASSVPFTEEELVQTNSATYTLTKSLRQDPSRPHCVQATIIATWKQGRVPKRRQVQCLLPLKDDGGAGAL